jgi:hypothetical protein
VRLLVSGTTRTVARLAADRPDRLGVLALPAAGNRLPDPPMPFGADNGCFKGLAAPAFLRLLAALTAHPHKPLWVCCPDVVADAGATWSQYLVWSPVIRALELPLALVLQDGQETFKWRCYLESHWHELAAVFVGGSTGWKVSDAAVELCREAKARGKLVHVGRVNSLRRIVYFARRARDAGFAVDTFDGGSFSRWGDVNIPKAIRWIDRALADRQAVMFGGNA